MENIFFEIESWSENTNEGVDHSEVYVNVDGNWVGHVRVNNDDGHIEYAEIKQDYRGKGLYKKLLTAAFELGGYGALYSNDRNELSNQAYNKWMGFSIPKEVKVNICISEGALKFSL